jgi:hypothetical protein
MTAKETKMISQTGTVIAFCRHSHDIYPKTEITAAAINVPTALCRVGGMWDFNDIVYRSVLKRTIKMKRVIVPGSVSNV